MWIKVAIVVLLIAAIISLFSGLVFMLRDQGKRERTANALLLRVSLCAIIIALVIYGFVTGELTPHSPVGLLPQQDK